MFEDRGAGAHLDGARDQLRAERMAVAGKVIEAGRFALARMAELGHAFEDLIVDDWELAAAELGAELGLSRGRACTLITQGRDLLTRLPRLAEVFATGTVDLRVMRVILHRTALITDPDVMSVLDAQLAAAAPACNARSDERITELVDWMIIEVDPEAVRRARQARRQRGITVEPIGDGMVEIHGRVDAAKGAVFDRRLDELARTTCPDDPRTLDERRADAIDLPALGVTALPCECGKDTCPAAGTEASTGHIVVHLLGDRDTVEGCSDRPALLPGYGPIPAEQVRRMVARATVRPVPGAPDLGTEGGYQPSRTLTEFIRCRDLTCRWPGCNVAAERCDIDHTVPWPYGPTHPSNTKLYCRIHHLIKTFHCGPQGWRDQQHPDGTITITAPNGRVYTTTPDGALFFPPLDTPTATLVLPPAPPPNRHRDLAAPTRTRTRAQNLAYRIAHERALNRADIEANPPPF
ncbi:HNH endonuclease signature motif containing protein [Mycolicibacterium frederiksbergense]|uniref:HNH endonuclease signature motif containing protein n=1 Tax=Mycolicibacterium frederiksbergense TaxID=117567 RepID=UPI00399A6F40